MPETIQSESESEPSSSLGKGDATREQLLNARVAFHRGDFRATRRTLEVLLRENPPEPVRQEAQELKEKLGTDRVSIGLAIACLVLFAVVALTYLS